MTMISLQISGTTPLLCNKFYDAAQIAATGGEHNALVGNRGTPREQAESRLYLSNEGIPTIPQPNLFRCVVDAGRFFRTGKVKITTARNSIIPACMEIPGVEFPIESPEGWTVDTRAVRIPSTGGRILCHRPCFHVWGLSFVLVVDDGFVSPTLTREIVDAAGRRIGLGDFRPDRKGPFGKFVVTSWIIDKDR